MTGQSDFNAGARNACGKSKDVGDIVAGPTRARDIHEGIAQQAQRHDAQDATGGQDDVVADIKRTNAELRGKPDAGHDVFPEFEAPHLTLASAAGMASRQSIPDDTAALISLKRMAVGLYLSTLNSWRRKTYCPPYSSDVAAFESEYRRARAVAINLLQHVDLGGTSIDVDAMVAEPQQCYCDYTERPWENDAFFCGDMATAYWKEASGLLLKTYPVDQCSRAYELAYSDRKRLRSEGNTSGSAGGGQ